jgi:ssDNA-binding Zn-finger/Zn-ribbon topoisomerase 1
MEKPNIIPKGTFWVEDKQMLYMVRCPKCNIENYALNVASGICTWCGWDVNENKYICGEPPTKVEITNEKNG